MINRGKASGWKRTAAAVMALGLVAGACSSSSGDEAEESDDSVVSEDADTGDDTADDTGDDAADDTADDAGDDAGDDTVEVVQSEGGRLAAVQEAGVLRCGGNETLPGFGIVDSDGNFSGFDIDYCRVVAAAVLGDAEAVEIVPLNADARFPSLQSGDIDVLIRNTTWTGSRDGEQGANFLFTTFYDGQGMMVPASTGFTTLEDLADASICVLSGTTTELNLTSVFNARGIPFTQIGR